MPIYTQIHDFQDSAIPGRKKIALIQVERKEDYDYEKQITGLIAQALWEKECDWLILPQGTGSELLDKTTARLMEEHQRDMVVVCGSYLHQGENRSTILIKKGKKLKVYYQKNLHGKKDAEDIFCRHIFVNTGMGDFAILFCNDKVDKEEMKYLENLVDLVVFLDFRPDGKEYEEVLTDYCVSSYSFCLYASQSFSDKQANSALYFPYQDREARKCQTLDKQESIAMFWMDIPLLEEGRKGFSYQDTQGRVLSNPLASPVTHYNNPDFRSKETWMKSIGDKEQEFCPASFNLLLERWQAKPKGKENWKLYENLQTYPVSPLPFKIGRTMKSNLIVENQRISSVHAEIFSENNQYYLRDLGSTAGTYILKKKKLKLTENKEFPIKSGECFWLCKTYCFCVRFGPETSPILEIWEQDKKVSEHAIHSFPFFIGKDNPALSLAKYHGISKQHVEISKKQGVYYIRDLKSRYGTYIDPKKTFVKIKASLKDDPYLLENESLFCLSKEAFFVVKLVPSHPDNSTNKKIVYSPEPK
ncbi:MAG: FHA domain-containing protein [Candidatus Brocadiae bacterium]|nr:FHA domain-containing protein [Candidatus Brocadiia bacterium]